MTPATYAVQVGFDNCDEKCGFMKLVMAVQLWQRMLHMQDLMSVNRSVTPWVIVHGHRPAYATVADTASVIQAQDQRNAFEDIFVETGVSQMCLLCT